MACDRVCPGPGSNIFRVAVVIVTLPLFLIGIIFAISADVGCDGSIAFPVTATHVPTFYSPKHRYYRFCHIFLLLALASVFGGIHCLGWNFSFPSYLQQMLWRTASLSVAIVPLIAIPIDIFVAVIRKRILHPPEVLSFALALVNTVSLPIYAAARLILLGQAIELLRHLPPTALKAVDWAQFYPRFF